MKGLIGAFQFESWLKEDEECVFEKKKWGRGIYIVGEGGGAHCKHVSGDHVLDI